MRPFVLKDRVPELDVRIAGNVADQKSVLGLLVGLLADFVEPLQRDFGVLRGLHEADELLGPGHEQPKPEMEIGIGIPDEEPVVDKFRFVPLPQQGEQGACRHLVGGFDARIYLEIEPPAARNEFSAYHNQRFL